MVSHMGQKHILIMTVGDFKLGVCSYWKSPFLNSASKHKHANGNTIGYLISPSIPTDSRMDQHEVETDDKFMNLLANNWFEVKTLLAKSKTTSCITGPMQFCQVWTHFSLFSCIIRVYNFVKLIFDVLKGLRNDRIGSRVQRDRRGNLDILNATVTPSCKAAP